MTFKELYEISSEIHFDLCPDDTDTGMTPRCGQHAECAFCRDRKRYGAQ